MKREPHPLSNVSNPALKFLLIRKFGPNRIALVDTLAIEETGHLRLFMDEMWQWTRINLHELYKLEEEMNVPEQDRIYRLEVTSSRGPNDV